MNPVHRFATYILVTATSAVAGALFTQHDEAVLLFVLLFVLCIALSVKITDI